MTKRLTITCLVAISLGFLAAAPAQATIGSVISSFYIPDTARNGIYRESNYVYTVQKDGAYYYLRSYSTTGSYLSRIIIDHADESALYSGSRTHLGAGYVALCDRDDNLLKIFSITGGGLPVASFSVMRAPTNCFWTGEYYYVNPREVMPYCGGATYAQHGNESEGPYFVASPETSGRPCCITTFPGGSLVRTWTIPSGRVSHLAYGDSSQPSTYGAAIWAILNNPWMVIEFDIDARGASSVVPASVGKVKAIYR